VKDKLKRFGIFTQLGERRFFATIDEAVSAFLAGAGDGRIGATLSP